MYTGGSEAASRLLPNSLYRSFIHPMSRSGTGLAGNITGSLTGKGTTEGIARDCLEVNKGRDFEADGRRSRKQSGRQRMRVGGRAIEPR